MEINNYKILFLGTPYFARVALDALVKANTNIAGVITQPDKATGRGKRLSEPEVKLAANKYNIPVFQPNNNLELLKTVQELKPDLMVVAAYGKIISEEVLKVPKFGSLNIHGSLLPKYRGSSCISSAILNGDETTGITIMEVSKGMDEGDIISKVETRIDNTDTTLSLTEKLAKIGAAEIVRVLPEWLDNRISKIPQEHQTASYCSMVKKEDGHIDWSESAEKIERMTRAYYPWPSAYTYIDNKMIKIIETKVINKNIQPGLILIENKKIFIGCGKDLLEIINAQPEGKKVLSANELINGNFLKNNTLLK